MKHFALALVLGAIASAAPAQERDPRPGSPGGMRRGYANPSAVIAAEMAFARLAQTKGQWSAFRETAAPDAVMFQPRMVLAQQWLKDRANPPAALRWQPHSVWSSCDGSLMVTTGAWQGENGRNGWFTTVWQRQPKGGYKWVLDHGDVSHEPIAAPDMITARVADCSAARPPFPPPAGKASRAEPAPPPFDPSARQGSSRDGTLRWSVMVDASGAHRFLAEMAQDAGMASIRDERVAAGR